MLGVNSSQTRETRFEITFSSRRDIFFIKRYIRVCFSACDARHHDRFDCILGISERRSLKQKHFDTGKAIWLSLSRFVSCVSSKNINSIVFDSKPSRRQKSLMLPSKEFFVD